MGRARMLASTLVLGFVLGVLGYLVFDWVQMKTAIARIPVGDIVFSPWFLAGLAGSALAMMIVVVVAFLVERS